MLSLVYVGCALGPNGNRGLLLAGTVRLICVSGPFHMLLPFTSDQEAPCIP